MDLEEMDKWVFVPEKKVVRIKI